MQEQKPRQIAVRLLKEHAAGNEFLDNLFEAILARSRLSPADRALLQELTFGVVRWQAALDWLIAQKTNGRAQKLTLQIVLRLGLYQLFWLERIPDHAAVNESVELARQNGCGPQAGFVNALLRRYLRDRKQTEQLLADLKARNPALGYSHPEWLVNRWQERWPIDDVVKLLQWNNTPPPAYARLNTCDAATLLQYWEKEGVVAEPREFDWAKNLSIYELKSFPPLKSLSSFEQGMFYIQDPSTLLAVNLLAPQPGERVLDGCAAPGGKTTLIAQLMEDRGLVSAEDISPHRLDLVRENCLRLGVTCVKIGEPSSEQYDRILIDTPCSNTGAMRRRVDLRWRIKPEEISRLRETQLSLLNNAATKLKPGGTLVYSTCSLEPEENESVLHEFLQNHSNFKLDSERALLPFRDGVDGAYVARLTTAA